MSDADHERARLRRAWPDAYSDGERGGALRKFEGPREKAPPPYRPQLSAFDFPYPLGFHQWPLDRRNAWYSGYGVGLIERQRAIMERVDG